jgi:hypothetical protein
MDIIFRPMNSSSLLKLKLALAALAASILLYPNCLYFESPLAPKARAQTAEDRSRTALSNPNLILFKRALLDTGARADLDTAESDRRLQQSRYLSSSSRTGKSLRVVQFRGPVKRQWFERLGESGAEVIGYVPHNAYIIRGTRDQIARVASLHAGALADEARPIRWMGELEPAFKVDPAISVDMLSAPGITLDVEIELLDCRESEALAESLSSYAAGEPRRFLKYMVIAAKMPSEKLLWLAGFDSVLHIGPAPAFKLHDERSLQIIAANLSEGGARPGGPGYKTWLQAKGLTSASDFIIDFTDTGIDRGSTSSLQLHPDFRDHEGRSRVDYYNNYTTDGESDDRGGHGSLVASVAAGLGNADFKDSAGYMYGLGVDPAARIGVSRLFGRRAGLPFKLTFTEVASAAYAAGARISNNSWGNGSNVYDAAAQEYDALVRDALPGVPGNQQMVFVFSAGNNGPGGNISSPGTAKNVITVAASENFRPEGFDSCNLDGQGGVGPDGADSALDILRFSAGGPTFDGRVKPDIAAPGTHIYGAASQSIFFNGSGLCPGIPVFQPPGQSFYTWSSGTSLAAPHVTGSASLVRRLFTSRDLAAPSPAMTKAFLINSASYLTGENAGGDLPHTRQGWGLANLTRAFDDARRSLTDQTTLLTESGQTYTLQGSIADRTRPLRITLAWTDAPGQLTGAAIVNDLDLEINIGGTIYRGNNFSGEWSIEGGEADRLNNVESIYLPAEALPEGASGNFVITVRAANIAGDGVPGNGNALDQDFALVVYNISNAVVDPPPPPPPPVSPAINGVTYIKKRLTITGINFGAAAQVEINGELVNKSFEFNAATNSLTVKKKYRKLNLRKESDNQIVIIEDGKRSNAFTLRL